MKRVFDDRNQEIDEMFRIANELNGMLQSPVSKVQKVLKKKGLVLSDFTFNNGRMYREFWSKDYDLMSYGVMVWFQSNGAFESKDDKLVMVSPMGGDRFQKIKEAELKRQYDSKQLKGNGMKRVKDAGKNTFGGNDCAYEDDVIIDEFYDIDGEEHFYDMECYDGYAIGHKTEYEKKNFPNSGLPDTIKMTYPKISELSEDEIDEALRYRGLKGQPYNYGDIMMKYGKVVNGVSDSRKIKDAEEDTPAVLDGILLIAFNDGEEEDGYNAVKQHANEQGELDGVQYETYDTDYQDGVTLIDLCAMTDDANAFVKALLNEWGVIESVADIEFEASDNMKEAVSDSKKIKDNSDNDIVKNFSPYLSDNVLFTGSGYNSITILDRNSDLKILVDYWAVKNKFGLTTYDWEISPEWRFSNPERNWGAFEAVVNDKMCLIGIENVLQEHLFRNDGVLDKIEPTDRRGNAYKRAKWEFEDVTDSSRVSDMTKPAHLRGYAEKYRQKRRENPDKVSRVQSIDDLDENYDGDDISDSSRVNDMIKPAHLRGYAEKYRQKRRNQKNLNKEENFEDENADKQSVSDSRNRKVKDAQYGKYKFDARDKADIMRDEPNRTDWHKAPNFDGFERMWSEDFGGHIYRDADYIEYYEDDYGRKLIPFDNQFDEY